MEHAKKPVFFQSVLSSPDNICLGLTKSEPQIPNILSCDLMVEILFYNDQRSYHLLLDRFCFNGLIKQIKCSHCEHYL